MDPAFRIATLDLDDGGRIGICHLPGRLGNLAEDLAVIRTWRPAIAASMTEQHEMDAAGSGDLGRELGDAGIEWVHFPIRDYGGPDGEGSSAWPDLSTRLHAALDGGNGVLLHCFGGIGRSGMIALRLLTERGRDGDQALAELRAIRPGAVETDEQLAWANAGSVISLKPKT